jgi:putative exosortase-associated protein (TIGR04073 family)
MSKLLHILSLCLLISISSTGFADESKDYGTKVGNKALSGLTNITTGALEIPKSIINTTNDSNFVFGVIGGVIKGMLTAAGRISSGVVDLATAPIPTKPIVHPERIWDDFDQETTYGKKFRLDE